jgi:hypothetical protein
MVPISKPTQCLQGRGSGRPAAGTTTGSREGINHLLDGRRGQHVDCACPYSGLAVPSMMPLISLNCRRTSTTTEPAARPTASMAIAPKEVGDESRR